MGACFGRGRRDEETSSLIRGQRRNSLGASYTRARGPNDSVSIFPPVIRPDPTRLFLDPLQCTVTLSSTEYTVGTTTVATINLMRRNSTPYYTSVTDYFQANVQNDTTGREVNVVIEPVRRTNVCTIRVTFTVRVAGEYTLSFMLNGGLLGGHIIRKHYLPGPPDAKRTVFHHPNTCLILTCNEPYQILFSPRDSYGNIAAMDPQQLLCQANTGGPDGDLVYADCEVNMIERTDDENEEGEGEGEEGCCELLIKIGSPGYYMCCVKYAQTTIGMSDCIAICLTSQDATRMENNVASQFLNISYNGKLFANDGSSKEVSCYISPRLFQVRGYKLFLISSRLFTCRVCNSTKFIFLPENDKFIIDDGLQPPVTIKSSDRELMAAVFYKFIQRNIGGARSFNDKLKHFQDEIKRINPDYDSRGDVRLVIRRFNLLESSMQATRRFDSEKWKKHFHVQFEGEAGIDIGGVSREFITCLCDTMFSGRNPRGMFKRFNEDTQALVHPNYWKRRDKNLTMEHYRFAGRIVGKCLYDTAIGNRLLVKAKFTRSFLAQIIGLRISWKHFETDDPDLYNFKVKNIRDSNINDLELSLTFAEEEFDSSSNGSSNDPRLISITPGGTKRPVTDSNKMEYLNKLANYRLAKRISDEMREFLKGLHELIPDDLLGIFDENELELLMCGVQELSIDDLKDHTQIRQVDPQIVSWFWTAVEEFSQEELARLVQFVTGSSQIPTGGFRELRPQFLLAPSGGTMGYRLPYAHTCFNHLCLPDYDNYEQFRRALMTAINEGSEGVFLV